MKNILFYSHFYYPEMGAAPVRIRYLVKALKNAGFSVKVIAPKPNYPKGKIFKGYGGSLKHDNIENVTYLPIYFTDSKSAIGRLLSYFSYSIISFFYSIIFLPKFHYVISSSPPIFTSYAACLLAKLRNSKFILDIRDVWPDIGIELGILKSGFVISLLSSIEKTIVENSSKITVTALGDKENYLKKGISEDKIEVIYNGADFSRIHPLSDHEKNEKRKNENLPIHKKLIIYFGSFNYGMNDIEILAEAILLLTEQKDKFHFISVGEGNLKDRFIGKIKNKINYTDYPSLSPDELAELLPLCDFSVIPRKAIKKDTGGNIPVKCFESWAAGLPIVLSTIGDSELNTLFDGNKAIEIIESGDAELLSKKILEMISKENLKELGMLGRSLAIDKFDRNKNSELFAKIIE